MNLPDVCLMCNSTEHEPIVLRLLQGVSEIGVASGERNALVPSVIITDRKPGELNLDGHYTTRVITILVDPLDIEEFVCAQDMRKGKHPLTTYITAKYVASMKPGEFFELLTTV